MIDDPWALPLNWRWARFDEVARVASNLVDPTDYPDSPHIAPNHIESGTGRLLPYASVREDGVTSPKHRFFPGQVLYSKIRPYLAKVVVADFDGLCSADMYPIESEMDPRFLKWWMLTREFTRRAAGEQARTVLPKINVRALSALPIPVPSLAEQRRIVEILEDHLSRLDAADAGLANALQRSATLRESMVRAELTGFRKRPGHGYAELEGVGVDDGSLPALPPDWLWKRLHEVADVVGGVTKDAKRQSDPTSVEVPYLRVANVQRGRLDLSSVTSIRVPQATAEKLRLLPGDVLLNEGGDRDKLGRGWVWEGQVEPCIHQNHVFRARARDSQLDPYLLSWAANSFGGQWCERNGRQSVNLASISLSKIKMMPVPVPPRDEQEAVAGRIREVIDASLRPARAALIRVLWAVDPMTSGPPGRALQRAFARRSVEAMTDRRSFERGLLYAANGRVGKRTATESSVKAKVRGSSSYQVKLSLEDGQPGFDCSCPVGIEGRFCKHAVALALVVTEAVADPGQQAEAVIDIRAYLAGLDHDTLVDLLVERAAEDEHFDARLRMSAARATEGAPPIAVFRHALDEAFAVGDYVGYREMYDYATNIESVLDSLRELLDDGHAEAVIKLAEHAIDRAEDAVGYVDDSDGWMSTIAERLQELHHDACAAAKPEPIALARTLFERERHSGDLDVFHGAASTYAKVLGKKGLAEYRRLAQEEWDALPPLGPGQEERSYSSPRFRITQIMETLAELTGDVDAVADVLARDQSSAYQFVRIAELYTKAGRCEDALGWAEKGLALHGGADSRLVEAAAEEYHRAGRGADAVQVAWDAYDAAPALRTYRQLAEQATRAGLWQGWHDKAITLLRERIAKGQRKPARGRVSQWAAHGVDGSTLVEVLLYDGNVELAWAEASAAGCRRDLWLELAKRREGEHPLEAIPIWQGEIERVIDAKNNHAYAEAVDLIARVGRLIGAADRGADFASYTTKLRATHKPKRNLMKLFDERSW